MNARSVLLVPICSGLVLAGGSCSGSDGSPGNPATQPPSVAAGAPGGGSVAPTTAPTAPTAPVGEPSGPNVPDAPGRVRVNRLSRTEYNNTVRDLLGTTLRPADSFPGDESIDGFDNVGDALTVGLVHTEQYEKAADQLAAELFARDAEDAVRQQLIPCDPGSAEAASCRETVLRPFMRRAFRRPIGEAELQRRLALSERLLELGVSEEDALRLTFKSLLMSPEFLYQLEFDDETSNEVHRISAFELASRLSYFLWSSMPDDVLLDAAENGQLSTDEDIRAQVIRMRQDEKAQALVDNFADQWLLTREVLKHEVDGSGFEGFSEELKQDMRSETLRVFKKVLAEDRPVTELITADYTFVNARLAQHYGFEPVADWTQIDVSATERRGLLGQAGPLTLSSTATRTSPTRRGSWVLSELLCSPPPAPPEDVETDLMEEGNDASGNGQSVRDALAEHSENPACAGCHTLIDPIGLSLEGFDLVGRQRSGAVDTSSVLWGTTPVNGAVELADELAGDRRFVTCVMKNVATYGVGRVFSGTVDRAWVEHLTDQMLASGGNLGAAIETLILSPVFRSRSLGTVEGAQP